MIETLADYAEHRRLLVELNDTLTVLYAENNEDPISIAERTAYELNINDLIQELIEYENIHNPQE